LKRIETTCAAIGALAITAGIFGATTRLPRAIPARTPGVTVTAARPNPPRAGTGVSRREIECLATAIWHEAGNQPRSGQIAVAEVVMRRRATGGMFPRNACRVITQPHQFSFVRAGVIPAVPAKVADDMRAIAHGVVDGSLRSSVRGAMFFHATYVSPNWGRVRLGQIGAHVFYR